jgi:hypothetical protein
MDNDGAMEKSLVFVTSSRNYGITGRLRAVAEGFPGKVAMTESSDPKARGEAIAAANSVVLIDGHYTDPGCVDELGLGLRKACPGIKAHAVIVGCCWSGKRDFTDAVRPGLDRRVAYLGYSGDSQAPYGHAGIVFPPVLRALLNAGFADSVDMAQSVINDALEQLRAERPRMKSLAHWNATVLTP